MLFWISDSAAWLLVAMSVLVTVTYPITGPVWARMAHQPLATSSIVATCLAGVSVAIGAYLVTRRKIVGLLLMAPVLMVARDLATGMGLACVMMLVFGLPHLLVVLQARRSAHRSAT
jgi:hypothetical protein